MNNDSNNGKIRDIHERIYQFVIRVLNLLKKLPNSPENLVIREQLAGSATSMGANDQEADGAESKKDFIAKYTIVKKEGKESNYWLRVIAETNPKLREETTELTKEGKEIVLIVSSIIMSTKGIKK